LLLTFQHRRRQFSVVSGRKCNANEPMSRSQSGKVYLIGGGPGDVGLVTAKAYQILAQADVVVYDHLANPVLVDTAPPAAERIYAGKKAGAHAMSQEDINALLIEKARAGKCVARLKGGDPFVFGRGGEEALALAQAGIPFEIVPGVTSAIAVPAYAGIPVTHRDMASAVHIFTGHEAGEKDATKLEWKIISQLSGTLVFLMGASNLPIIVQELVRHGRSADTPAAVIQWGTMPEQVTVTGTLDDICKRAKEAGIGSPAVTVIGETVRLRKHLKWFEVKPLFGCRVALTRPFDQSEEIADILRNAGADVIVTPTIAVKARPLDEEFRTELLRLHGYDWVIFTSTNGVNIFFDHLSAMGKDARSLSDCRLGAIGEKTAETLRSHGIIPDAIPGRFVQEALAEAIPVRANDHVLIPRAAVARDALEKMLVERGAKVRVLPLYDTLPDKEGVQRLLAALSERRVNVVTFTSASTFESITKFTTSDELKKIFCGVTISSIGPVTTSVIQKFGLEVSVEAAVHTGRHLAEAIISYWQEKTKRFSARSSQSNAECS
jgi:uroporphyrinogen III methyltransferase/synthase